MLFATGGLGDRGQASACSTDERTVATAQEAHFARNDVYAASLNELVTEGFLREADGWHQTDSTGAVTPVAGGPCA